MGKGLGLNMAKKQIKFPSLPFHYMGKVSTSQGLPLDHNGATNQGYIF